MTDVCVVCKQSGGVLVKTPNGLVHNGVCLEHIQTLPVTENTEDILQETELLM